MNRWRDSLAPATGRRIGYPTRVRRPSYPEADLLDESPVSDSLGVATPEPTGKLLAVMYRRREGSLASARETLRRAVVTIGRGEDNDLVIDDPSVSEHHARLALAGGIWTISDLGSVNGTRVDGEPTLSSLPIAPGSAITIGNSDWVFAPHDSWEDSEPPTDTVPVSTADIVKAVGSDFALDLPSERGVPIPVVFGFVITIVAIVGYLLSRGV